VRDAAVGIERLGQVDVGLVDELPELGYLADLLEGEHLLLLVAVDGEAGRVVAAVLEAEEACRPGEQESASPSSQVPRSPRLPPKLTYH